MNDERYNERYKVLEAAGFSGSGSLSHDEIRAGRSIEHATILERFAAGDPLPTPPPAACPSCGSSDPGSSDHFCADQWHWDQLGAGEPRSSDGPDYHADHAAWVERAGEPQP